MLHTMYSTSDHDNVFRASSPGPSFPAQCWQLLTRLGYDPAAKFASLDVKSNPTAWLMITLDRHKEWMASAQVNDRPWDDSIDSCWGKPYRLASVCARNALSRSTNFIAPQTTPEAMYPLSKAYLSVAQTSLAGYTGDLPAFEDCSC
ncbi:hypothetical protein I7I48_10755 [Histoplasma ohiense]|nr:hypothetical protein I7I48_10755 [Histoplasma ohiense (nom. inval.)]